IVSGVTLHAPILNTATVTASNVTMDDDDTASATVTIVAGPASISGCVFFDANNNGVDDMIPPFVGVNGVTLGAASQFATLGLKNTVVTISSGGVSGNVGISAGDGGNISGSSFVTGTLFVDKTNTTFQVATSFPVVVDHTQDLTQANTDALAA